MLKVLKGSFLELFKVLKGSFLSLVEWGKGQRLLDIFFIVNVSSFKGVVVIISSGTAASI